MKTRKSIDDRNGDRSIYVIEHEWSNKKWIWLCNGGTFMDFASARIRLDKLIKEDIYKFNNYRIALYVRAE